MILSHSLFSVRPGSRRTQRERGEELLYLVCKSLTNDKGQIAKLPCKKSVLAGDSEPDEPENQETESGVGRENHSGYHHLVVTLQVPLFPAGGWIQDEGNL